MNVCMFRILTLSICIVFGTLQVNGQDGVWTPWSSCDVSCGQGQISRTRTFQTGNSFRRETERRSCHMEACPGQGGAVWTEWTDWSTCNRTCDTGYQSRSRDCNGNGCPQGFTFYREFRYRSCNMHPCSGPPGQGGAVWTEWTDWSTCNRTCDTGYQSRSRDCNGNGCPQGFTFYREFRYRSCNMHPCSGPPGPVGGTMSPWTPWSQCDVTCGIGRQERRRTCTGSGCPSGFVSGTETAGRSCDAGPCTFEAVWTEWTPWSACNVTCGTGIQNRTRSCRGHACPGGFIRVENRWRSCFMGSCTGPPGPDGGTLSPWTPWSQCDVTCGIGRQERTQTCTGSRCPSGSGSGTETVGRSCDAGLCPSAGWSVWGEWRPCDVTCGFGRKVRFRSCSSRPCPGSESMHVSCSTPACPSPVEVWSDWTPWSSCNVTCGSGVESRTRTCSGNGCPPSGRQNDVRVCNPGACVGPPAPASHDLFECTFEGCDFVQNSDDQFDWIRNSGGTDSAGTGPSNDHTQEDSTGVYYYAEASSPRQEGDRALMSTPVLTSTNSAICLSFWYHMYGNHMGTLNVFIVQGSQQTNGFTVSGNQENTWHKKEVYIPITSTTFQIQFEAVTGNGYEGDIAVDDVTVFTGDKCEKLDDHMSPDELAIKMNEWQAVSLSCTRAEVQCLDRSSPGGGNQGGNQVGDAAEPADDECPCTMFIDDIRKRTIKKGSSLLTIDLENCISSVCLTPGERCDKAKDKTCHSAIENTKCKGTAAAAEEDAWKKAALRHPNVYSFIGCNGDRCNVELLIPRTKCSCANWI